MRYDLAIVGSGAAGFAAAITARRAGASVVMVEQGKVGGTCVNTGCVPSKALLAAAQARRASTSADRFPGLSSSAVGVDPLTLIAGKDALVEVMRRDKYGDVAALHGWEIITGAARFAATDTGPVLVVNPAAGGRQRVEAEHYLIATGSAPAAPTIDGLAEVDYLNSTTAMALRRLPTSLVVIGGNAIGLEMAQMFAFLGTDVTVIEVQNRLAPFAEPEVSTAIQEILADDGISVRTGAAATKVARSGGVMTLTVREPSGDEDHLRAERLLVAVGRRPVTAGLALNMVGVKTDPAGHVIVDHHLQTSNPRIWAAGDVTGAPQYVYVAANHGDIAADNAVNGVGRVVDYHHLPRVSFTSPAIASIGLTEAEAVAAGFRCDCRVLSLAQVPRAIVNRDTRGVIKLVAEAGTRRLLGIHGVADNAGEIAAAGVYILAAEMTVDQLASLWSPYLTATEGLKLAAQTFTRDIAALSCCAA